MAKRFIQTLTVASLLLCATELAEPGLAQSILPAEPVPEEERANYQLSCYAETATPRILTSPNVNESPDRVFAFDHAYSFIPDSIIRQGSIQLLGGTLVTGAGRVVYKGVEFQGLDRDQLFVLATEWHCKLYRGGEPWPLQGQ